MKEFWEQQAIEHGESVAAVNFDPIEEDIVAGLLNDLMPDGALVADMGCGNGRALIQLAAERPNGRFVGYDFAENMVRVAEARRQRQNLANVRFFCFDATSTQLPADAAQAFDMVLGKRVLINVKGSQKIQALKNIADMLKPGGTYLMMECFDEPLQRINDIRERLGLEKIVVRSFNEYLVEGFLEEVRKLFVVERVIDRLSLYYFISRVFNAYLSGGAPEYQAPINQLAAKLSNEGIFPMTGYAPEVTYVLKKR